MNLAVVVGQTALNGMATKAGHDAESPDFPAPLRHQSERDGKVDADKPEVASRTIQNSAQGTLLVGKTCQLSVATVINICPDEQEDAQDVNSQIVEIEADARSYAEKDGKNGHHVRGDMKHAEKSCPLVTDGTIEININMLLGIRRFQRSLKFLIHFFLIFCLF